MTLTNEEAVNAVSVLARCQESGRLGYAIAKNLRRLKDETADYTVFRDELLRKYGTPMEGGQYELRGEDYAMFREEIGEISTEPVEFDPYLVDEETFMSGGLTSDQMSILLWMVR